MTEFLSRTCKVLDLIHKYSAHIHMCAHKIHHHIMIIYQMSNVCSSFIYLVLFVNLTPWCTYAGQRTTSLTWLSPSTFTQTLG